MNTYDELDINSNNYFEIKCALYIVFYLLSINYTNINILNTNIYFLYESKIVKRNTIYYIISWCYGFFQKNHDNIKNIQHISNILNKNILFDNIVKLLEIPHFKT
jgi:hypothetical protein